jgi:hypothetical protein
MATSEIEKLERRYAENPHGLTFAPLAEVHRKNGDTARALELLRIGLELHPNYIPASIVLGRCHQDLGDLAAAESAFAHVLRLDDENVIALKSLADMNERQDRLEEAERWLHRLVSVDRSNDEARQQLERIEAAKAQAVARDAAVAAAPSPSTELAETVAAVETSEPAAPIASASRPPSEAEMPALELMDEVREVVAERLSEPVAAVETTEVAEFPAPVEPLQQLEPAPDPPREPSLAGLESSEFEPPKVSPDVQGPLGLEIETESDVVLNSSGASEFTVPDASQDFAALAAKMNAARPRNPGRRASDKAPGEPRKPPIAAAAAPEPPPDPVPPQPEARVYSGEPTKGPSVGAFFRSLLAARPPGNTSPSSSIQPSRASLNGESSSSGASGEAHEGLVSFDDFFGAAAGGTSRETSGGEPGKDDLDQFHSWLQNLKR